MTTRDNGYAIGALHVTKGLERLPTATNWTETDHEFVIELAGERTLVLSKAEHTKVGRVEFREPVVFGLTGGWHFTADDPYARFVESLENAGDGEIHQRRSAGGTRP